jgi:hypothetical protein
MKRSITRLGLTLGSASLIALGLGCSRENRPAATPATGESSPTFESNVPSSSPTPGTTPPPAPPPPPGVGEPGPETAPPSAPPSGEPNAPSAPGAMEQPTGENERKLCDALASGAILHVEDVQNGVAIVAIPKRGHDIGAVRDDAQRLQIGLLRRSPPEASAGETCGLFSAARLPGVNVALTEGTGNVRIMMTTPNPAEIRDVRRIARDQVRELRQSR